MSALEKLLEVVLALNTTKKKEKLEAFQNLFNLLNQNDTVKNLHNNSLIKDNNLSWDVIFAEVHNASLSIIDEHIKKSRQLPDKNVLLIQNIIQLIVQKSLNQKVIVIGSNLIVSSILAVFETDFRSQFLGSTYLKIFSKFILAEKQCWSDLKEEYWLGMKNLCKKLIKKPPAGTNDIFFLETLCEIIKNSSKTCQISHNFLDLFDFIKEIYFTYDTIGAKNEILLVRLINTLCLQLAVEFRFKVCEFTEDIFNYVISYRRNNPDLNILVNHFFIIALSIHNPCGVNESDKSFYAFNSKKWRMQIKQIYLICWSSIKNILKDSTSKIDPELFNLFIEVSHLVVEYGIDNFLDITDFEMSYSDEGPVKKRKFIDTTQLYSSKFKLCQPDPIFQNLDKNLLAEDNWFWLKFLESILCKYPKDIKQFYPSIAQVLCQLLCIKKNDSITKACLRCLYWMVETENILKLSDTDIQHLNGSITNIYSELLRCLESKNYQEAHALIQTLIKHSKLTDCRLLLKLYCNESVKLSFGNFKTLSVICQNCILPEVIILDNNSKQKNIRETLLRWLMNGKENYSCEEFAKLLVALILKKFDEGNIKRDDEENILVDYSTVNDFCKLITRNYQIMAFKNIKFSEKVKPPDNNLAVRVDISLKVLLKDLLKEKWKELFEALTKNEISCNFQDELIILKESYWFCELMCYLFSYTKTIKDNLISDLNLTKNLEATLSVCMTKTLNLLKHNFFDLSPLSRIYAGNFLEEIHIIIRDYTNVDLNLLHFLFEIFSQSNFNSTDFAIDSQSEFKSNSGFSQLIYNPKSMFHFKNLTQKEKIFISIVEFLCQYIVIPGSFYTNKSQISLALKIIDQLLENIDDKICSDIQLHIALRVVYSFTKFNGMPVLVLNGCIKLLETILSKTSHEFEINIVVLQIWKDFLPMVYKVGNLDSRVNYIKILEDFGNKIIIRRLCGVKTVSKFVECLAEIYKFDPERTWTGEEGNSSLMVADYFLSFLNHSFLEVRISTAQLVGKLFVTDNETPQNIIVHQKKFVKNLFLVLNDNENLYPKKKDCVFDYVSDTISSVSLISLAGIICQSDLWKKKSFFYLIHLAHLKKFKKNNVNDILQLICEDLQIKSPANYFKSNLEYFLSKWAKKKLKVEEFPFYILGYQTFEAFLLNHHCQIILIYSQVDYLSVVHIISTTLGKSIGDILLNCIPMIAAFILPNLRKSVELKAKENFIKLRKLIDEHLSLKTFKESIEYQLDEVIFYMIKNMHDIVYFTKFCTFSGNIDDDFNLLSFTGIEILDTVVNLSSVDGKSLLEKTILERPSVVEKVLSLLLENIFRSVLYQDKVFAFYKYIFFVEMISNITKSSQRYRGINSFIIRDVIYSLKRVIQEDQSDVLTDMSCACLEKLAKAYINEFADIFGEFLPVATTLLIPLALKSNAKALTLLNYLIFENYFKLEKYIVLLDPFPKCSAFDEINRLIIQKEGVKTKRLKDIIKNFVQAGSNINSGCRIEGLKNLNKNLSEKKCELKKMFEALTTLRGFSEDCKNSLLHQLVCMLVELTTHNDFKVKVEAAKCLGELGPSDLTTLVLRPDINLPSFSPLETPIDTLFKLSLNYLSKLLITGNCWVKKAATNVLYAILSVQRGRDVLGSNAKDYKNFEYLRLFQSNAHENLRIKIQRDIFVKKIGNQALWIPDIHEKWIVKLVDGLLQCLSDSTGIINSFRDLIGLNWEFAELLLPLILDLILYSKDNDCSNIINENFRLFFKNNFNRKNNSTTSVNKKSVQCLLNVVDYIRTQKHYEGIYQESCLGINYLHFAEAALFCSAFFTSIFYAELWFEQKRKDTNHQMDVNSIFEMYPEETTILTQILRDCYSKIGSLDGIHGCGYMHVLESSSEIQHYEHMEKWNLSLLHHDIQLSLGNMNFEEGLMNSLERSGMYYLLNNIIKTSNSFKMMESMQYKCAANLSDWSLLDCTSKTGNTYASDSFDKSFYFALKAFHNEDDATMYSEIRKATKIVLNELSNCSLESTKNMYSPIAKLQRLKELEEFASILRQDSNKSDLCELFNKWQEQNFIKCGDFSLKDSILTNRTIFLKVALQNTKNSSVENDLRVILCQTYCHAIVSARKEKKYEIALRMLNYINNLENVPQNIFEKLQLEKSRILWEKGDRDIGKFILNHIIKKKMLTGNLKAKGLRIYGDWMAVTKSENSGDIISNYYLKSISSFCDDVSPIKAYASLAKFADVNYEQLNQYLSSPLFEIKQNLLNTQQGLASELRQELGCDFIYNKEKRLAYQIAARQSVIDENEIKNNKAERDSYLCLALKYYMLSLKEGEQFNFFVFRIISLWMSNSNHQDVLQLLKKMLPEIPSYKFLCLLPQLIPRMPDICLISTLIEKILQDHPYHTLPLLFALSNSHEDLKYNGNRPLMTTPRVQASKSMLEKFQKHEKLGIMIQEMDCFSKALIELANYQPPEKGPPGFTIEFPDHLKIKRIKNFSTVAVPSISIPYEKDGRYENIIGVEKFGDIFYLVGGINLPKKIKCFGSDGVVWPLLVKGKDDLRQDAVMQQVFTIMNSLLSQNVETKKRKLIIRTYKVVPLSQRSGIIEWCENTQPLSLYLTGPDGKSGAHKKFYPEDLTALECRSRIRKVFGEPGATNEDKLNVFLDICKRFHPVFHYFFLEKYPAAGVWFERRLAYIHSVATSSMIGYILGIGDRHVHNILIDNSTAEVIHIDLGVAFEQGKTLPIPETVPFRLTRDIVDGMGFSGIEGDFRISCIKTMEVLRENRDVILTLLEVLLYDPLYTWTITPEKAYLMQGQLETSSSTTEKSSPDPEINKMAERALIIMKQKFEGTEGNWVMTNVEGQISYLVQQARDPNNLSRLFHGWQAYL